MEHSYPVNGDAHPAAQRVSSPHTAPHATVWDSPENAASSPNFFAQMEELLGERSEPDPEFFIESWTMGVETATHRFQARRDAAIHREDDPSTYRPFDFSVPLNFVEDASYNRQAFSSAPAGFSAAWKDAYGVRASSTSSDSASPRNQAQSDPRASSQPLTLEDACRLLGVAATSTQKQIKTAYRQLVWRFHPDRLAHSSEHDRRIATDRMISINEAYHLLCGSTLAKAS